MRSFGDALKGAQAVLRKRSEERRRLRDAFLAAGGTCFDCGDTGWTEERVERHDPRRACARCAMGRARLAEIRAEVQQLIIMQSPLTPLAMPLDSLRVADADAVGTQLGAWLDGWPDCWRAFAPHTANRPFVLLHGPTGSGKTTTAAELVNRVALHLLLPPNVVNAKAAIDTMRERGAGRDPGPLPGDGTWRNPAPLLVDDLAVATHSEAAEAFHYSVVQARYERRWPTVFTTNANLNPNGGDRTLISRIGARSYWRIMELAVVVEMTGYNWRDARYTGRD